MNNVGNNTPFLRTSREFPEEIKNLTFQINKAYIEIANAVNNRTISIFPIQKSSATGESWFLFQNKKQQTLRQVFTFTTTTSITHGINVVDPNQWTRNFGEYTDGTNGYGLIFATNVAIPGQITFYLTSTQIVFVVGAGAPLLSKGRIVLEWLSSV